MSKLLNFRKNLLSSREAGSALVKEDYPIKFYKEKPWHDATVLQGKFETPMKHLLPEIVPPEVELAHFQIIVPKSWNWEKTTSKPICIHLAGTGDHYFWRRRNLMVKPLLKQGIGSIILENPYYGLRKPRGQFYSGLFHVSDVFVMGACLILECIVLLRMCEKQGFGPLGVTGLSMGGHMASLVATYWPKPLVLVPCLSWSTASAVFTEGVMSNAIEWDHLQREYFSNEKYHNNISKMCRIVDDPSQSGLIRLPNFIQNITEFQSKCCQQHVTIYEILEFLSDNQFDDPSGTLRKNLENATGTYQNKLDATMRRLMTRVFNEKLAMKLRDRHAIWFMRGLMDEFTHLKNFPIPVETSLIIAICAQRDGYVPREGCTKLDELWPGSSIRYINCGHVQAFLRYLDVFRRSIVEAFDKAKKMWPYERSLIS